MSKDPRKVQRFQWVKVTTGSGGSTIYDRMDPNSPRYDPTFPRPIRIGLRAVGWFEDEILAWVNSRPRTSSGAHR